VRQDLPCDADPFLSGGADPGGHRSVRDSEQLPPLPQATTATVLPAAALTGADVDAVKFTQVLRGYKTSEVDWVLDRLGAEIDLLRAELDSTGVAPSDEAL